MLALHRIGQRLVINAPHAFELERADQVDDFRFAPCSSAAEYLAQSVTGMCCNAKASGVSMKAVGPGSRSGSGC
jgi:hypothetical protein